MGKIRIREVSLLKVRIANLLPSLPSFYKVTYLQNLQNFSSVNPQYEKHFLKICSEFACIFLIRLMFELF